MPKLSKDIKPVNKNIRIVPDETKLQAQCFELYYSLCDTRTITKLSKKCIALKLPTNYQNLRHWKIIEQTSSKKLRSLFVLPFFPNIITFLPFSSNNSFK